MRYRALGAAEPFALSGIDFTDGGRKSAAVFHAPLTGNIVAVWFHTSGSVTTGCDMKARIENVAITPDGSLVGTGAEGVVTVPNGATLEWFRVELDTPAAVTVGQHVAVVLEVHSGTPSMHLLGQSSAMVGTLIPTLFTHGAYYQPASWQVDAYVPNLLIEYADDVFPWVHGINPPPIPTHGSGVLEHGIRFRVSRKTRIVGCQYVVGSTDVQSSVAAITLYNDSFDTLAVGSLASQNVLIPRLATFIFGSVELSAGHWYRLVHQVGSVNKERQKITYPNAESMASSPLWFEAMWTEGITGFGGAGSWTDDPLSQALMWPLVDTDDVVNRGQRAYVG